MYRSAQSSALTSVKLDVVTAGSTSENAFVIATDASRRDRGLSTPKSVNVWPTIYCSAALICTCGQYLLPNGTSAWVYREIAAPELTSSRCTSSTEILRTGRRRR